MILIFTGLIEEIGEVISIKNGDKSVHLKIKCDKILKNSKIGDSISTNGTCLTAVEIGSNYFVADCMHETIKRTNLKRLKNKSLVNLEKSISLSTPLGGHIVTGDVDCEGTIKSIFKDGIAKIFTVEIENRFMKYVVEKGRISIDGASLSVVEFKENTFSVSLIPHTQKMITLGNKKVGDFVNIETDLIGKYIERFFNFENKNETKTKSKLTKDFLASNGFF